ncbi:MAG: DNA-directed RNA polymerase subunit omega [Limisphaerales bacterium]
MNPELVRKALDRVVNPNVLVNLVSRRVRQLNSGNRPLLVVLPTLGAADVALSEIIEGKMNWDAPETPEAAEPAPKKRRKH